MQTVTGTSLHEVEGGFLVHPDWDVQEHANGWGLRCDDHQLRVVIAGSRPIVLTTEVRPMHPDYSVELLTKRLTWRFTGTLPLEVRVRVEPVDRIGSTSRHQPETC